MGAFAFGVESGLELVALLVQGLVGFDELPLQLLQAPVVVMLPLLGAIGESELHLVHPLTEVRFQFLGVASVLVLALVQRGLVFGLDRFEVMLVIDGHFLGTAILLFGHLLGLAPDVFLHFGEVAVERLELFFCVVALVVITIAFVLERAEHGAHPAEGVVAWVDDVEDDTLAGVAPGDLRDEVFHVAHRFAVDADDLVADLEVGAFRGGAVPHTEHPDAVLTALDTDAQIAARVGVMLVVPVVVIVPVVVLVALDSGVQFDDANFGDVAGGVLTLSTAVVALALSATLVAIVVPLATLGTATVVPVVVAMAVALTRGRGQPEERAGGSDEDRPDFESHSRSSILDRVSPPRFACGQALAVRTLRHSELNGVPRRVLARSARHAVLLRVGSCPRECAGSVHLMDLPRGHAMHLSPRPPSRVWRSRDSRNVRPVLRDARVSRRVPLVFAAALGSLAGTSLRAQSDPAEFVEAEVFGGSIEDRIAHLRSRTADPGSVDFDRHVRPILSEHCFHCHGPSESTREAGLRLDLPEVVDTAPGSLFVPGDIFASLAVDRILPEHPADSMPPPESTKPLSDVQRRILVEWIEQGAAWQEHWAFLPPRRHEPPNVHDASWPKDSLDHFVLATIEAAGLTPSPAADPARWLRRVTFDLTGLPPTVEDLERYLEDRAADPAGADVRVVDRLLASDAYGEHRARYWLDAARYGDTHGLHLDNYREMWPYRDWVVDAFRRNLSFRDFVVEQLAGDLLPNPTLDQQIATGFLRCNVTTAEGGSIEDEVYVRNVVDRTSTVGTVFLGLSVGCAVCHDHKFDPIGMRDFYSMFAFFNNIDGKPLDGNAAQHPPVVKVPSEQHEAKRQALEQELAQNETEIANRLASYVYEEPELEAPPSASRVSTVWIDDALPDGAKAGDVVDFRHIREQPVHSGRLSIRLVSDGGGQHFFVHAEDKLRVGPGDTMFAWVYLDPADPPQQIMLQWNSDGSTELNHRAYWGANEINFGRDGTSERRSMGPLPPVGEWVRLEVDAASIGLLPGMVLDGMAFTQYGGTAYWDEAGIDSATAQHPEDYVWIDDATPDGAQLSGEAPNWQWVERADGHPVFRGEKSLRRSGGDRLNQDVFVNATEPLVLQNGDRFFAHVWLDPNDPPRGVQLQFNDGSWEHRVRWGEPCHGPGRAGGADAVAGELPPLGEWVRLEVDLATVGLAPGRRVHGWAFTQTGGTVYWDAAGVNTWSPPNDFARRSLELWQHIAGGDTRLPKDVKDALAVAPADRSEAQATSVRNHYLRFVNVDSAPTFAPYNEQRQGIEKRLADLEASIPTTLVMKERAEPRKAYVLERGQYDLKGEELGRATPEFLPSMEESWPTDRLGFAYWLVDERNPLTARVAVNRIWQELFGTGLVKTSEDFGNQGERPSHPELLDTLAVEFRESGWDVKALYRRLVLSATYRQSSVLHDELRQRDPQNRLLARGPRFRLDAEMLRDQALAVSGLLVRKLGGPGVKPPQPDGLWKAVAYVGSNTMVFKADEGPEKVHRRSLYTFWKRTAPPPQMATFDAPSRESCTMRRERTNTPLQALLLMNDPQYVECHRAFAGRVLQEAPSDGDVARIRFAMRQVLLRDPAEAELAVLQGLLARLREIYRADPEAARATIGWPPGDGAGGVSRADPESSDARLRLASTAAGNSADDSATEDRQADVVEWACWTMIANQLFNLDEAQCKE